jgi:hypothetical protein
MANGKIVSVVAALFVACATDHPAQDGGAMMSPDASAVTDASMPDSGSRPDSGDKTVDGGPMEPSISVTQVPLCSTSACANNSVYTAIQKYLCVANNPNAWPIKGFAIPVFWNQMDSGTTAPAYDWRTLDAYLNAWVSACPGDNLNLLLMPALEGGSAAGNKITPSWVFTADGQAITGGLELQDTAVGSDYRGGPGSPYGNANGAAGCDAGCAYNINGCVTPGCAWANSAGDTSGEPVYLPGEPITIAWLNQLHQFFLHYSSVTNCALGAGGAMLNDCSNAATVIPAIGYVRAGCVGEDECVAGADGYWPIPSAFSSLETAFVGSNAVVAGPPLPSSYACSQTGTGGTQSWVQYMVSFLGTEIATYSPQWATLFDIHDNNGNYAYGACTALYASEAGIGGVGQDGTQASDITNYEDSRPTNDNWVGLLAQYPSLKINYAQMGGYSDREWLSS